MDPLVAEHAPDETETQYPTNARVVPKPSPERYTDLLHRRLRGFYGDTLASRLSPAEVKYQISATSTLDDQTFEE